MSRTTESSTDSTIINAAGSQLVSRQAHLLLQSFLFRLQAAAKDIQNELDPTPKSAKHGYDVCRQLYEQLDWALNVLGLWSLSDSATSAECQRVFDECARVLNETKVIFFLVQDEVSEKEWERLNEDEKRQLFAEVYNQFCKSLLPSTSECEFASAVDGCVA